MQNQKEKPTSKDDLAVEIAKAFQEVHRTGLYKHVFQHHKVSDIVKAFDQATEVPAEDIRKSRSALFFFLLNKYEEK